MSIRHRTAAFLRSFERHYETHNRIDISQATLLHNLQLFTSRIGMPAIPVLKGNAYGHGTALVAQALRGLALPYIAVDGYFEALRIRDVSRQPVLIMGAIRPDNYSRLHYDRFAFVVQHAESIRALGQTGKHVAVHLEINTGMNRYGTAPGEAAGLVKLIGQYRNLRLEGVMSHLADSDGDDPATVDTAVTQFDDTVDVILAAGARPTMFHVAQSAGSLKAHSRYASCFRLGLGLYGINPFPAAHPLYHTLSGLQPALRLTSTITNIIDLQQGDTVSYNRTFTAPHALRLGVLPLGYYEGLPRALSNAGVVKIGTQYAPIVGRVCMNHTMVNLEGIDAHVGDAAIVISDVPGDLNSVASLARTHQLFPYSLLTSLSSDVRRVLT